jgi:hypothetical protein
MPHWSTFFAFLFPVAASALATLEGGRSNPVPASLSSVAEVVSAKVYGAKGDGLQNDTAALQAALRSNSSHVYVPSGVYRITETLRIPSNKRLTLAPGTVMLRHSGVSAMLLNDADDRTANYSASSNIIVEGGIWDGNAANFPSSCTIIGIGHAAEVIIRDCLIRNTPEWHAIELNGSRRCRIERVTFDGCPNEAVQLDTMNSGSSGVFPWFGPYNDAICRDIVIEDCIFRNVLTAIGSHSAPPVDGLVIRRCTVFTSTASAVLASGYLNMTVEDCQFFGCRTAFSGNVDGFALRRNTIVDSSLTDINLASWRNGSVEETLIVNARSGITNAHVSVTLRNNRQDTVIRPVAPTVVGTGGHDSFVHYQFLGQPATGAVIAPTASNRVTVSKDSAHVSLLMGDSITMAITAMGTPPPMYQWHKDGAPLAGEIRSELNIPAVTADATGEYFVTITNLGGKVASGPVRLAVSHSTESRPSAAKLTNLSVRSQLSPHDAVIIAGFGSRRNAEQTLLIRAIGPTLRSFGISSPLPAPRLELYDSRGAPIAAYANWPTALEPIFTAVGAFALPPGSSDAAAVANIETGSGTVQVRDATVGVALVELFSLNNESGNPLANLSARAAIGSGEGVLVAGFTVTGLGEKRVLIRGVGPRLSGLGVGRPLADPLIELYSARGTLLAMNDDWNPELAPAMGSVGAFPLERGSKDASMLVTLPGDTGYTVILRGVSGTTGEGMIELYEVL